MMGKERTRLERGSRAAHVLVAFVIGLVGLAAMAPPAAASTGGPVILMGIDAEDGGPGGHGPIGVYQDLITHVLSNVANGGSGILVIGGGKTTSDNVTRFWAAISSGTGAAVTFVNSATNISNRDFAGF